MKPRSLDSRERGDLSFLYLLPSTFSLSAKHLAATVAIALALVATAAQAADPFYTRLLREGTDAYNRKDYGAAERKLRVACFGFLDEPDLLADGLTRLALAQAADGDTAAFDKTFERIVEVEERFQGYSHANTSPEVRAAFEREVVKLIPAATLAERPAFAHLIRSPGDGLTKAPAAQRRKDLERLIETEPTNSRWPLMLADLDLTQGDPSGAEADATAALKLEPGNREALRLRGVARAAERRWTQALDDLGASGAVGTDRAATEADLRSLVELGRFQDANDLYARLPQPLARDKEIQRLGGVAAVGLAQARSTPTPLASTPTPTPTLTPAPVAPTAVPTSTPTAAEPPTPAPTPTAPATTTPATVPTRPATPVPAAPAPENALITPPQPASTSAARTEAKPGTPTALEQTQVDAVRALMSQNRFGDAMVQARRLADAHPDLSEAQFLAAELAYRTLRWSEAVAFFRRGGDPGNSRPLLLFYEAIALYESGDRSGAVPFLKRSLPKIEHTRYVNDYTRKILGPGAGAGKP